MPRKRLTQAQRQANNVGRKAKQEAGTTTRVLTATKTTGFAYAREFTIQPEKKDGVRRRGLSVGRRETTTNTYANRTVYKDDRPTVTTALPPHVTTQDVDRQHSHEAVPAWHEPGSNRFAGDVDTNTYGDVTAQSVRKKSGGGYNAP